MLVVTSDVEHVWPAIVPRAVRGDEPGVVGHSEAAVIQSFALAYDVIGCGGRWLVDIDVHELMLGLSDLLGCVFYECHWCVLGD